MRSQRPILRQGEEAAPSGYLRPAQSPLCVPAGAARCQGALDLGLSLPRGREGLSVCSRISAGQAQRTRGPGLGAGEGTFTSGDGSIT